MEVYPYNESNFQMRNNKRIECIPPNESDAHVSVTLGSIVLMILSGGLQI
jgi:hypothetical protein